MHCGLVMPDVTGPEPYVIPPAEKGEHTQKELIERPGFKGSPVHEFMTSCATHKSANRTMGKQG